MFSPPQSLHWPHGSDDEDDDDGDDGLDDYAIQ